MIADKNTSELVRTDGSLSADSHRQTNWTYRLLEGRPTEVRMQVSATGTVAVSYRDYYSSESKSSLRDELLESYKSYYGAEAFTGFEFSDPFEISSPFTMDLTFTNHSDTYVDGDTAEVSIQPESIFSRVPASLLSTPNSDEEESAENEVPTGPREHDYNLVELHRSNVRYEIVAPSGYRINELPDDKSIEVADVRLAVSFEKLADNKVVASFSFDTGKGNLTPNELSEFRKEVEALTGDDDEEWGFHLQFTNQAVSMVTKGDYRGAVEFIQSQMKERPDDPYLKMQLARALLSMGLGKASRKFAKQSVAAEPNSSYLQAQLGMILTHDLVGRHWGFGFDRAGAIKAYEKACELEKDGYSTKWNLALVYEHPESTIRYGDPAGLELAAGVYSELLDEYFSSDLMLNYLNILIRQNRFDEILKQMKDVELNRDLASFVNTANIIEHGLEEANNRLAQQGWDDTGRLEQLYSCARSLNGIRKFDLAIAVYEQIQPLVTTNLDSYRKVCETFAKSEFTAMEVSDPRWPVQNFLFWILDNGNVIEIAKPYIFSPNVDKEVQSYVDSSRFNSFYDIRDDSIGASDDRLREILSILNYDVKTLGEFSWITVGGPKDKSINLGPDIRFLVKKEGGEHKIVMPSKVVQEVGRKCFQLINSDEKEDVKLAKSMLRRLSQDFRDRGMASPVSDLPFLVVYQQARKRDLEDVRLAAAFASFEDDASKYIHEKSKGFNQLLELQRLRYEFSRAYAQEDMDAQVKFARQVLEKNSSGILFDLYVATLTRARKFQAIIDFLDQRSTTRAEGPGLKFFRAAANAGLGNVSKALEIYEEIQSEENPIYNNSFAWLGLFADELPKDSLAVIEKVVNEFPNSYNYHTYAAILAEMGRLSAAKAALGYSFDYRSNENMIDQDGLVLGLIAEKVGLPEIAAEYYRDTIGHDERKKIHGPTSAAALAKKRLARLNFEPVVSTKQLGEKHAE